MKKRKIEKQQVRSTFLFLVAIFSSFLLNQAQSQASHIEGHTTTDFIPHGSYTTNTNACGKCHQIHLAQGANLLRAASKRDTCFLCHDGTGSNYNIKAGKYASANGYVDTVAGGFDPNEGFTSSHLIEKTNIPPGGDAELQLVCTSCHNPHGTTNHRLLRTTVNGNTDITVTAKKSYSAASKKEIISYDDYSSTNNGIPKLCTSCHKDYIQYSSNNVLNGNLNYRHRMNMSLRGGNSFTYSPSLTTTLPTAGSPSSPDVAFSTGTSGGLTASTTYKYEITAYNGNGESVGSNEVTVSTGTTKKSITISWKSITNATGYNIYRKVGTGAFQLAQINSAIPSVDDSILSFTDSGTSTTPAGIVWTSSPLPNMISTFSTTSTGSFTDGQIRKYLVTAETPAGEIVGTQEMTVTSSATASQTGWSATGRQIKIDWQAVSGATGYNVYRDTFDGTGYKKYSFSSLTYSFTDIGSSTTPSTTVASWTSVQTIPSSKERVVCLTCHFAHGTKTNDAYTGQSKLKRIDNMGVCQNCHKR